MNTDLLILVICNVANLGLGASIFLRNPHSLINRIFGLFSLSLVAWTGLNYSADHVSKIALSLWLSRLTLIAGIYILFSVFNLSRNLPKKRVTAGFSLNKVQLPLTITVTLLCLTPWVVKAVKLTPAGADLTVGTLYFIFVGYIIQGVVVSFHNFFQQRKAANSVTEKRQIVLIISGLLLYAFFAITSNILLPVVINNWQSSRYGPVFSLFVVGMMAYAIIKHRLFDIRLIVARSIAYLTSLVVLASIYGFLVFGASNLLFHLRFSVGVQIFIAAATAVASLSFANIKSFFDRITNRLFFRDSYDTQVFFDEFNQTLVATYELDQLLKESVKIIEQNIKPTHCQFIINKTANTEGRVMGTANKPALAEDDLKAIEEAVDKTQQKLIVADELETRHESLQKRLRAKNIVLAAALSSSSSGAKSEVGYLMLGPKKSGNLYSSQDLKVIEIVANELVIAVQNALRFEEIESFNITLQGKVDEATRKLRHANEKLKALDETKDDFISMASHQLRTPLTSVKGYISMVLEGDAGKISPTQKKLLTQSFFSSQRMVYLIADLLNVSRLKTGKFVIDPTPVNLAEIVEQELEQLKETADVHTLKLTYQKPKHFPELMLDETKTRQVIMNFVDNAIYYTPSGGHINVRLVDNPMSVELRVEDNGIGVPKSEQPHLFTKFYRAGNARKARPDGTGLGLFMAKKVIVAQSGSIIFESHENKGSTFGFLLSKHKLAVPAAAKLKSEPSPAAVKP